MAIVSSSYSQRNRPNFVHTWASKSWYTTCYSARYISVCHTLPPPTEFFWSVFFIPFPLKDGTWSTHRLARCSGFMNLWEFCKFWRGFLGRALPWQRRFNWTIFCGKCWPGICCEKGAAGGCIPRASRKWIPGLPIMRHPFIYYIKNVPFILFFVLSLYQTTIKTISLFC